MNKSLSKIIAVSGIDGSGKSSQTDLLADRLEKEGIKFKRVWLRWPAFFSYPFLLLCRLLGYTEWKKIPGTDKEWADRKFYRNSAISRIWAWLLTLDTLIYYAVKVRVPMRLGYHVLCDRYIPDVLVDLICDTKDREIVDRFPGKILLRRMGEVSLVLLDLDELRAYQRKEDIPSVEYLKKRRNIYLKLSQKLGISVVKAKGEPSKILEKIMNIFKLREF